MNFSHLLSRHENGIKVMVYVTLIAAMLVLVYRKLNQMSGFKIAKLRFDQELQADIIRELVLLCPGNPALVDQFIPLDKVSNNIVLATCRVCSTRY